VAGAGSAREWKQAGIWYLAGSNTCVYSNPKEELGATEHRVQTSNRRFRDDEFLIARDLTAGRSSIRVRVKFTPVDRPLFPGYPTGEQGVERDSLRCLLFRCAAVESATRLSLARSPTVRAAQITGRRLQPANPKSEIRSKFETRTRREKEQTGKGTSKPKSDPCATLCMHMHQSFVIGSSSFGRRPIRFSYCLGAPFLAHRRRLARPPPPRRRCTDKWRPENGRVIPIRHLDGALERRLFLQRQHAKRLAEKRRGSAFSRLDDLLGRCRRRLLRLRVRRLPGRYR
jgi:hypothetical protein